MYYKLKLWYFEILFRTVVNNALLAQNILVVKYCNASYSYSLRNPELSKAGSGGTS